MQAQPYVCFEGRCEEAIRHYKKVLGAERVFAGLADGGQVQTPLTETFWSPRFGMVADQFGVSWMVNVNA